MVLLILAIMAVWCVVDYYSEGFDAFGNEFAQVPGRILNWLRNGLSNIDLGYGRGAGTIMDYEPCPPNSDANFAQDCYGRSANREDGVNHAEPLWKANDWKWNDATKSHYQDGCSWNRHEEALMCFRACPQGYSGQGHSGCKANGTNAFGVMKYGVNRARSCKAGEEQKGLLCYPNCRSGYKSSDVTPNWCYPGT